MTLPVKLPMAAPMINSVLKITSHIRDMILEKFIIFQTIIATRMRNVWSIFLNLEYLTPKIIHNQLI
jgi:hypothetical protein